MTEKITTDKIVIEVNLFGETKNNYSKVLAREKVVTLNGEIVYKEWERWPQFYKSDKSSVLLDNFLKQVSFMQQSQPGENSSRNSRNFVSNLKFIWAKFLFKIVNFQ